MAVAASRSIPSWTSWSASQIRFSCGAYRVRENQCKLPAYLSNLSVSHLVEKLPCTGETDTLLLDKAVCALVSFIRSAFPSFLSPIIEDLFNKV